MCDSNHYESTKTEHIGSKLTTCTDTQFETRALADRRKHHTTCGSLQWQVRLVGHTPIANAKTIQFALSESSTKVKEGAMHMTAFAQTIRYATAISGRRLQAAGHGIAHA